MSGAAATGGGFGGGGGACIGVGVGNTVVWGAWASAWLELRPELSSDSNLEVRSSILASRDCSCAAEGTRGSKRDVAEEGSWHEVGCGVRATAGMRG